MCLMDKLDFALQVLFVGFFVVMFTLFILYGILVLFNRLFHKKTVQKPAVDFTVEKMATESVNEEQKQRTAAAIVAAVYQYMQEHSVLSSKGSYNIAIKPSAYHDGISWQTVGRKNILESRNKLETIRRNKQRENI